MATSQEKVKALYPRAVAKRYVDNGKRAYYLVWTKGAYGVDTHRIGEGKTASAAWVDAAKTLERRALSAAEAGRGPSASDFQK